MQSSTVFTSMPFFVNSFDHLIERGKAKQSKKQKKKCQYKECKETMHEELILLG
jgi:hypothetical protein